jgi:predicted MPP superfamily phosphohydrolase
MSRHHPKIAYTVSRLEALVYRGGWPVRLARALGIRPSVRTTRHSVSVSSQSATTRPLRIAYASDFHAGPTTDPTVIYAACDHLREAAPDILLLGGDFVTFVPGEIDWLAAALGTIPAPFGRFAVLGNHDWWSDAGGIVRRLEAVGISVLTNSNVRLDPPFDQVWICGLDDHWSGAPNGASALAGATGVRIVVMHAPSGLLDLGPEHFDLAFCGHTHGGQVALPNGVPIVVPRGELSRRYARGRFQITERRTLIVSVGLGCVVLPLRLFAAPEIIVCDLTLIPAAEHQRASERAALETSVEQT